jgi:2Fe-2S ferredoxin
MHNVIFVLADGERRAVSALKGASAMSAAMQACACATCHVYVDPASLALLPTPGVLEDELLDAVASERRPNSRLSCQIMVTPELDGQLVLHVPPTQV